MKKSVSITTITLGLLTVLAGLFALSPIANAQSAPAAGPGGGQALEIGPPVVSVSANPGETTKAQINLRDISSTKLVVTNEINDFVADGEDGTPRILLKPEETTPYSIKSWITPLPKFTLVPQQVQTLDIVIKVPANAAPGGYFGVIRFTGTPPDLEGTGVSLSASLGALVLLRVNGDAKEELAIEQFGVTKNGKPGTFFESAPNVVFERIKNTGNVHERPVGQVDIKDMFGNLVGTTVINNPNPRNVLPGSIRKFEQPLDDKVFGGKWLFGRYTVTMSALYGSNNQTITATTSFWVIPYTLIAIIVIVLIVLGIAIYFGIKRYNEYILSNARGRRR